MNLVCAIYDRWTQHLKPKTWSWVHADGVWILACQPHDKKIVHRSLVNIRWINPSPCMARFRNCWQYDSMAQSFCTISHNQWTTHAMDPIRFHFGEQHLLFLLNQFGFLCFKYGTFKEIHIKLMFESWLYRKNNFHWANTGEWKKKSKNFLFFDTFH